MRPGDLVKTTQGQWLWETKTFSRNQIWIERGELLLVLSVYESEHEITCRVLSTHGSGWVPHWTVE